MRPLADPISPSENTAEATDAEQSFSFKGAREKIEGEISALPASPGDDVTISCLGTGSAMPAKYRNGEYRLQGLHRRLCVQAS